MLHADIRLWYTSLCLGFTLWGKIDFAFPKLVSSISFTDNCCSSLRREKKRSYLACKQKLFYFSFRSFQKHRRARERIERARTNAQRAKENVYFLLSPPLPPCAGGNKSPAVYILSPFLDGLWRENRGTVNRLNLHVYALNSSSYADNN